MMTVQDVAMWVGGVVPVAVSVCAAMATFLPPPAKPGGYAIVYAMINGIGLNFGRAKNAASSK